MENKRVALFRSNLFSRIRDLTKENEFFYISCFCVLEEVISAFLGKANHPMQFFDKILQLKVFIEEELEKVEQEPEIQKMYYEVMADIIGFKMPISVIK